MAAMADDLRSKNSTTATLIISQNKPTVPESVIKNTEQVRSSLDTTYFTNYKLFSKFTIVTE